MIKNIEKIKLFLLVLIIALLIYGIFKKCNESFNEHPFYQELPNHPRNDKLTCYHKPKSVNNSKISQKGCDGARWGKSKQTSEQHTKSKHKASKQTREKHTQSKQQMSKGCLGEPSRDANK